MSSELIACAESLQQPCFHLIEAKRGDAVVGYWGGQRSDVPETFPPEVTMYRARRHLLSIDHALFDRLGVKLRYPFALTVWTNIEESEAPNTDSLDHGSLDGVEFKGGVPLTLREAKSFPPFQAVCLYGDERAERWLKRQGLERWQYEDVPLDQREELENAWRERCPMFADPPIVAQIGGWHITWPEDNYYTPREMRLLVWTFRDSEPWYEIFQSSMRNLVVKSRIT